MTAENSASEQNVVVAEGLSKVYRRGSESVPALRDATFSIRRGEIVSVVGQSGSGKTTLVNILGCLDNPTSGRLVVNGSEIFSPGAPPLSERRLTLFRRRLFGYVFQKFFLIPTLTVRENILLPSVFDRGLEIGEERLRATMELLGVAHRADHLPAELSGGEMQRVAVARALVADPQVLIADEPTGNLDSRRAEEIKNLFVELNRSRGITIILVTHNPDFARVADTVLEISDGRVSRA